MIPNTFITLLLMDIYAIGEKDYNDILPIIKNHDIVVRQHLMLCEMGAYMS
jgi:hypothetical protein